MTLHSAEALAKMVEEDRKRGDDIGRDLRAAEAQTLVVPARGDRDRAFYLKFAYSIDGFNVCEELIGQNILQWSAPILRPSDGTGENPRRPSMTLLRNYSLTELRLLLFALFRSDHLRGEVNLESQMALADDMLDAISEKLEKAS